MTGSFESEAIVAAAATSGLFSALASEDDLGVVIRSIIYIEHELDQFTAAVLPSPDELDINSFGLRLRIALACGLRQDLKKPLQLLAKLRNEFAHKLDMKLEDAHVKKLYDALSLIDRDVLEFSCAQMSDEKGSVNYHDLTYNDQLKLLLTVLWGAVVTERRLIKRTC